MDVSEQTQNGEDSSREGYGRDPILEEGAKTMLMRLDQSPVLKRRGQILAWLALATMLVVCPASGAVQDEYILRCSPTAITGVVSRHAMTLIRPLDDPTYGIYLVRRPAGASFRREWSEGRPVPAW